MPLNNGDILKFIEDPSNEKNTEELMELLIKRIDRLCFEQCQVDRIACTLTPMCSRRFLLRLRIKNGLKFDDLPKFCYSIHKGIVERHLRGKTVIYHPHDAYLYIIDFFDVFFHGDYRKLNKLITFKKWDDAFKIFNNRINNQQENFKYLLTKQEHYLIFMFEERIHVLLIDENIALCNANREEIHSLELLHGLLSYYIHLHFPDVLVKYVPKKLVEILIRIPHEVISSISQEAPGTDGSKIDKYFWDGFADDVDGLSEKCEEINLSFDFIGNLQIQLNITTSSNRYNTFYKNIPLRYRDLRIVFNFIKRIYQEYYILHLEDYLLKK